MLLLSDFKKVKFHRKAYDICEKIVQKLLPKSEIVDIDKGNIFRVFLAIKQSLKKKHNGND